MPDDGGFAPLVLLQKLLSPTEGNLIDVAVNFVLGHTYSPIRDGNGLGFLIQIDAHGEISQFAHARIGTCNSGEFGSGIYGIRYQFS